MTKSTAYRWMLVALAAAGMFLVSTPAMSQNGRPDPARPESQASGQPAAQPQEEGATTAAPPRRTNGNVGSDFIRPEQQPGKVNLSFPDVPVDEKIVGFIADLTGKVVMPINLAVLKAKKITLMHSEPVERAEALDLVFTALRLNGIGISETEDVIILDDLQSMRQKPVPVLTASQNVMDIPARGNFIVKIFRLREAPAEGVGERLLENIPDFATLSVDPNSNQIILYSDVATAQHFQRIISELDRNWVSVKTVTYRLAHADATTVSEQILELFETSNSQQPGQPGIQRTTPQRGRQPQRPGAPGAPSVTGAGVSTPGPVVELRVSVNVPTNSVTVVAEPEKIDAISKLITEEWDIPRPKETFRVYVLDHTDPIKMRDLIQNLMGSGGGSRAGQARGAGRTPGQPVQVAGGGAGAGISDVLGDIYRVEAFPDRNSIVVISKTTEALDYLDAFIAANDQPSYVGLPHVVELKHANAVSLADELNVLLAEAGTGGSLERPGSGLTAEGLGGFNSGTGGGTAGGGTAGGLNRAGGAGGGGGAAGTIEFPWQRGRPRDDQTEPSPLIGKVRIVPIVRQNALAVLAPISQRHAVVELIRQFDKPGRQVMISAIIAEVQLTDDMALGLRFSSSPISPTLADNAIGGSVAVQGSRDNILGDLFDTSVLDVEADINVILQALAQKTNVRIIQEPRVFTADNQEAAFFHGQDVPFITATNTTNIGGLTQSFEYKEVGVLLNVRPRITVQRDVDMEIRLMLSAVVPGQTLFGGAILDRRETNTKVIVKNAQTIVLSGLLKDVDSKVSRGLPLLSDIPLLGELFKSRENSRATSELVAFITPIVVDNPSENDDNFNREEREYLQDLSKPLRDRSKDARQQRDRVREKMLAPKTPAGEPIPLDEEGDPVVDPVMLREERPARPTPAPRPKPQPANPPPPIDVDELLQDDPEPAAQ